jgi:hypothetical protein
MPFLSRPSSAQPLDEVASGADANWYGPVYRIWRDLDGPEQTRGGREGGVQVVELFARTGLEHVKSDKGEGAVVNLTVGSSEYPLHEAHVGVGEWNGAGLTGRGVSSRDHPVQVGQANDALKSVIVAGSASAGSIASGPAGAGPET